MLDRPTNLYRPIKLFSKHRKKKNKIKQEKQMKVIPVSLDSVRDKHINMRVNVAHAGVYKNCPTYKEKDMHGLPIPTEIDFDREFAREEKRNLEIVNIVTRKLRSGRHKGEKIEVYDINNEPGKRYHRNAWK